MQAINQQSRRERLAAYRRNPFSLFLAALVTLSAVITLAVLVSLIIYILYKGIPNLKPSLFAWKYNTENVSMMPAIINTLSITAMTLLFSVPAGIFAAIYLVEYAKRGNKFVSVVRMTTETLAGIPSIVFGLFGYLFFNIYLKWGYSILGGALTLSIMVLPLILRTTEEALRSVSDTYREGSFGLGAGKLRTVFRIVLQMLPRKRQRRRRYRKVRWKEQLRCSPYRWRCRRLQLWIRLRMRYRQRVRRRRRAWFRRTLRCWLRGLFYSVLLSFHLRRKLRRGQQC